MNPLRLAHALAALCALVSCLLVFPASALAFAFYDAFAELRFFSSEPIVSLGSFQSTLVSPSGGQGFGVVNINFLPPPGVSVSNGAVVAEAGGFTRTGPVSSLAFHTWLGSVGPAPVTLSLTLQPLGHIAITAEGGETAHGLRRSEVRIDGVLLGPESSFVSQTVSGQGHLSFTEGLPQDIRTTRVLSFETGLHTIQLTTQAEGFALGFPCGVSCGAPPDPAPAPVPEPATLLLVGTTAAGLGLARWRQRRRTPQS